jgi:hypothetical protein
MERQLREEELLKTAERLSRRIEDRFPHSGLSGVAGEVVAILREALVVAERIRRPNIWLRAGLIASGVLLVLGLWLAFRSPDDQAAVWWRRVLNSLDAMKGSAAYLGAIALFLFTLEVRLKRRRALRAVHQLRAMAHLIDMHQLAKDPDRVGDADGPTAGGRPLTPEGMGHYLHYCTELLALVSKIGHVYVQEFPDVGALTAVDHCESLATGLSQKIWQKIMVLDRIRGGQAAMAAPADVVTAAAQVPEGIAPGKT